ncbi:Sugar transporter STL1 [Talaromyces islandicus]|uniref:Sugar transporter STL1 n=1 Tax=Talaromyces islandicus TaxID=28573 RepID=A0A0U1LS75_TALIS|nr:Sugar transporter STL1 [Talaromyces islandicus]
MNRLEVHGNRGKAGMCSDIVIDDEQALILPAVRNVNWQWYQYCQTETAAARWRGQLAILEMVTDIAGFTLVNWINYGLSFVGGTFAWRFPIAFQCFIIFILFATVPWLPEFPRRFILGAGTQFMQQFQGINIMSYYLPTVLINSVGLSDPMSRLLTACNATSYLIISSSAILLVERLGPGGLILISTAGELFSFLVITILLRYASPSSNGMKAASATIAFFFVYYIASLPMRTKGAAVATATNWITTFVIVEITPIGIQNIGWRFWIVWTIFNAAPLPLIYFFYPESANRTLEDLDAYYRTNPPLIVVGDPDAICVKRPQKYIDHEQEELKKNAKEGNINTYKSQSHNAEHVEEAKGDDIPM